MLDSIDLFKKNNIELTKDIQEKLDLYFKVLIEENEKLNLTRIIDEEEVYIKHFYDSLLPAKHFDFKKIDSLLDIGSGAGFPGVILKIFFPHIKVYLCESITKKATFLKYLVKKLSLTNIEVLNERAEKLNIKVDLITARAVTKLDTLVKYSLPLLNKGGTMVFYKGLKVYEELDSISKLKTIKVTHIQKEELPNNMGIRNNVFINKL